MSRTYRMREDASVHNMLGACHPGRKKSAQCPLRAFMSEESERGSGSRGRAAI
jgi:hypothetical protein